MSARQFSWSETDEPHATRRKQILEKYPELKALFVKEPRTLWLVLLLVGIQFFTLFCVRDASWPIIIVLTYVVGGTCSHSLNLAIHELSHNLCFEEIVNNRILAILANFGTGMPSAVTFARYHVEHHQFQGVDGIDVDIPSNLEVRIFTNAALKTLWIILQPLFYAFRPMLIKPKEPTAWEGINWLVQISLDLAILYVFGLKSLLYLLVGTLVGMGLHPAAGHFIAEHYQFVKGQETYSYYGPMNRLNFNVGYHYEHHDFPKIPWSKLPQVRKIAPEFYELPSYTSYIMVMYRYITDSTVGPFSRIKRKPTTSECLASGVKFT
jgi:sphingolipid delta-4 desaturase